MRKSRVIILFFVFTIFIMVGCSLKKEGEKENTIEEIVSDFYKSNYCYKETTVQNNKNGKGKVTLIMEGRICQNPYREYKKVIKTSGSNLWSESYYYGNGAMITALLNTKDGWKKTVMDKELYYGENKKLKFQLKEKKVVEGKVQNIYTTKYETSISKLYNMKEKIDATIKQEYYISEEKQKVLKIVTDLTDYNEKIAIANNILANKTPLEQAKKEAKNKYQSKEILEVTSDKKDISIEIPKIE